MEGGGGRLRVLVGMDVEIKGGRGGRGRGSAQGAIGVVCERLDEERSSRVVLGRLTSRSRVVLGRLTRS